MKKRLVWTLPHNHLIDAINLSCFQYTHTGSSAFDNMLHVNIDIEEQSPSSAADAGYLRS